MSEVAVTEPTVQNVGQAVAVSSSKEELDRIARMGMWLAAAESGSKDPNALGMAAALRIGYANSLGLPAHAASEVYVIKGNLTLSAKLCRALAHQHGLKVTRVEETPTSCTAAVVRLADNAEIGRTTYTMEQAQKQGLLSRPGENWKTIPDRMLWARASKRVLDDFAPWVTTGVMSAEEMYDDDPASVPFDPDEVLTGEVVDDDGQGTLA